MTGSIPILVHRNIHSATHIAGAGTAHAISTYTAHAAAHAATAASLAPAMVATGRGLRFAVRHDAIHHARHLAGDKLGHGVALAFIERDDGARAHKAAHQQ